MTAGKNNVGTPLSVAPVRNRVPGVTTPQKSDFSITFEELSYETLANIYRFLNGKALVRSGNQLNLNLAIF